MATARELPPLDIVRRRLNYDPKTGVLTWLPIQSATNEGRRWNSRYAGKPAGFLGNKGYIRIRLNGAGWPAHRIAYLLAFGKFDGEIDHINGNRADNRLSNLRVVSHSDNQKNRRLLANNSSGHNGINRRGRKWHARIANGGKRIFIGSFNSLGDAIVAYRAEQDRLGFHQNHGGPKWG